MGRLTIFGLLSVTAMLVTYALEARSPWFTLAFAAASARLGLWFSAGGLAVRPGGSDLGLRRARQVAPPHRGLKRPRGSFLRTPFGGMMPTASRDLVMTIDRRRFSSGAAALALAAWPRRGARAATPTRIGYVPVLGAAPLIVFTATGQAKAAGLDLELVTLDPLAATLPAIEGVATGVGPIVKARAAGMDLAIIASLATAGSGFVAVPALAARFYAVADDPVRAFAAFRDKAGRPARLATTPAGIVPNVLLNHWLFVRHAVPRELVDIVPMDLPGMGQAIMAGTVDGATLPEPMSTIARTRDPRLQRITSGGDMFPDMPGVVLGVAGDFAEAEPDVCRKLVRGLAEATRTIRETPAEVAPLVAAALGVAKPDQPLVTRALASSNLGFVTDPRAIVDSTRRMLAYETTLGDFKAPPDTDGLIDPRFFTGR